MRVAAGSLLIGGHGHVEAPLIKRGCPGDAREWMIVHLPAPEPPSGGGVERISGGVAVAEVDGVAAARPWSDHHGVAHAATGAEGPVNATGLGIERIDGSVMA